MSVDVRNQILKIRLPRREGKQKEKEHEENKGNEVESNGNVATKIGEKMEEAGGGREDVGNDEEEREIMRRCKRWQEKAGQELVRMEETYIKDKDKKTKEGGVEEND